MAPESTTNEVEEGMTVDVVVNGFLFDSLLNLLLPSSHLPGFPS